MTLCACGCLQETHIAKKSDLRHGQVKGEPMRFLKGHHRRGVEVTTETRQKISLATQGDKAGNWKGDRAGYRALHSWLNSAFPKSGRCVQCDKQGRTDYALEPGRDYSRDRDDYQEVCHRCHMRLDLGGRTLSPEAKQRISDGRRLAWQRQKEHGAPEPLRGEMQPGAKLTQDIVFEIRSKRTDGRTHSSLADEYGVSRRLIGMLLSGQRWGHVPPAQEAKCVSD